MLVWCYCGVIMVCCDVSVVSVVLVYCYCGVIRACCDVSIVSVNLVSVW